MRVTRAGRCGRHVAMAVCGAVGVVALAAGCSSGSAPFQGDTVSIRSASQVDSLDPIGFTTAASAQVLGFAYDRLTYLGADGQVAPGLARSWQPVSGGYRFSLVPGATCADGAPVTADVVARSLSRLADPSNASPYVETVFGTGRGLARAVDPATVEVTTDRPFNGTLLGLAMPWSSIVCPSGITDPARIKQQTFGSGPYRLTSSTSGTEYTLTRRDGYRWGPGGYATDPATTPRTLLLKSTDNESTAANQLLTGGLDIASVRGPNRDRVASDTSFTTRTGRSAGQTFMLFNQRAGRPAADKAVRTAVAMAISRPDYLRADGLGEGQEATSYFADFVPGFDPDTRSLVQPYDLDRARKVLLQAGYTPGPDGIMARGGKPLSLTAIAWTGQNAGPDYIVAQLTKIGIRVELQNGDLNTFVEKASNGNFDIGALSYASPIPSFAQGTGVLTTVGQFSNRQFDQAAAAAPEALDLSQASRLWADAQRSLLDNVNIAPLYGSDYTWFARSGLSFELTPGSGLLVDPYSLRRNPQ